MGNLEVAKIFRDIAKILEIKEDNPFRIRAYERAAQNIEGLSEDLGEFVRKDTLLEIPGIGKDLQRKIKEFLATGRLKFYEDLKKNIPEGLLEIESIPSLGPKTTKLLYEKLKIKSLADLEKAIARKKLKGIFGIKEKTIENIQKGIAVIKRGKERMTLAQATAVAVEFTAELKKLPEVKKMAFAGSLRRQKETVRDVDILVISDKPTKVMSAFTKIPSVKDILAEGETKSSVRTKSDVQVDCRVVEPKSFGAALLYFTGSKNFNIKLRQLAIRKNLKVNEYGIFRKHSFVAGRTEEEIFKKLNLEYVEPEMREDNGEIELALKNNLPKLIALKDLKGDLHTHSRWSDGNNPIEEMARAAQEFGYSYIAITDHSQSLRVANGLKVAELKKKKQEIEKLNKRLKNFRVLYGTEADIDSDGKIDYKDGVLKEFDIVVAAIHTGFKQSSAQLTRRLVAACKNKHVHIIAHLTGRLWGVRDPYAIDFEEVLKAARDTNTHLEINAFPQRLDLNDLHARRAKESGVKLAISTDSHETSQLSVIQFGLAVARRAWLSKEDVINTLSVENLLKEIKK
ncbi:MAG: DNA polymerase/3'-5' exonuclease PolX [Candidatus Omnitrophota bacterium]